MVAILKLTLALTVIADVIPPRERSKIQGVFGGVFGLSSIAGPLAGHASSVVLPFLLPDTPVVTWWPGDAPAGSGPTG